MTDWLHFDLHGRARMRVEATAPTAALLGDMFRPFRVQSTVDPSAPADITVTGKLETLRDLADAEDFRYTESALYLPSTNVQIVCENGGFRVNGTRELLVSVLPLVDRVMVTKGAAMIHATVVNYKGAGINMPAAGGVGKTSTMAKLLKIDGVAFMGDDWAFLTPDGELLAYHKPMFIKPHHRPIYPHLFAKRKKPIVPVRLSRPLGRLTTRVHPYITRYPQLARIARRYSPEHMMTTPQQAFPKGSFAQTAPLKVSVYVERHDGNKVVMEPRDTSWMVARLLGNFHAELSEGSRDVVTALGGSGLVPMDRAVAEKAAIVRSAVERCPSFLLQVPKSYTPDKASDIIVENLQAALAGAPA